MKKTITALVFSLLSFSVLAGEPYSVAETTIGTLLKNPESRAILEKYMPETLSNEQFTMAEGLTLKFVSAFDQSGELTEENLDKIDAELKDLKSSE